MVGPNTRISRDLDLRAEGHEVGTVQLGAQDQGPGTYETAYTSLSQFRIYFYIWPFESVGAFTIQTFMYRGVSLISLFAKPRHSSKVDLAVNGFPVSSNVFSHGLNMVQTH